MSNIPKSDIPRMMSNELILSEPDVGFSSVEDVIIGGWGLTLLQGYKQYIPF